MSMHVRAFERWESWADQMGLALYPLTVDKFLKFYLVLDQRECGPSVVPTFKTAVRWVTTRLPIDAPDLDDHRVRALQGRIVAERAKTLKEAIPIPMITVAGLEELVCTATEWEQSRIFVWWILCVIFASTTLFMRSPRNWS